MKRLYKSRNNRVIDGVCGGISEYFDVDPTIVRLLTILVTLLGGTGFILYIIAMIIMPVNPDHLASSKRVGGTLNGKNDRRRFFGVLLILAGSFVLLMNFGLLAGFGWWSFSRTVMLPVLLILLGAFFIWIHTKKRDQDVRAPGAPSDGELPAGDAVPDTAPPPRRNARELRRSRINRKLFGVCGGLAGYFDVDPTLVRFIFIFLVLLSFGWGLLLYIVLGIVMPEEKLTADSV